jgi:hypothetical protein
MKAKINFFRNDHKKGWNMESNLKIKKTYPLVLEGKNTKIELRQVSLSDFFSMVPNFERRIRSDGYFTIGKKKLKETVWLNVYKFGDKFSIHGTTYDDTCFTANAHPYCSFSIRITEKELRKVVDLRKVKKQDIAYIRQRMMNHMVQEFSNMFEDIREEIS